MPGTAHVLRVSLQFPIMEVKASPAQPDGGEWHSVITTGYPVRVPRKTGVALLRLGDRFNLEEVAGILRNWWPI